MNIYKNCPKSVKKKDYITYLKLIVLHETIINDSFYKISDINIIDLINDPKEGTYLQYTILNDDEILEYYI